jgi:hypothetical protein
MSVKNGQSQCTFAAREMVIECKDCGLQSSEVFGELQPQFSDVLCLKLFQVIHPFSKK